MDQLTAYVDQEVRLYVLTDVQQSEHYEEESFEKYEEQQIQAVD